MSNVARAETWDVEVALGVVHTMTLDELDAAYQRGLIDDATRVRQSGAPVWSTLAAVAGVDEPSEATGLVSGAYSTSLSPMLVNVPPPPAVPRELTHLTEPGDDIEPDLRPAQNPLAIAGGILGVAAVAGLLAFGAARAASAASAADLAKSNASSAMRPAEAQPLPAAAGDEGVTDRRNLTDEQRRALLEADRKRSADSDKKRTKGGSQRASAPRSGKVHDGLLEGGDKFDPLNGRL